MERRRHQRVEIDNLSVDVADGSGFFKGLVSDVSKFGVCISDLSKQLNTDTDMTILVSGKGGNFRMNVRPRWYSDGNTRKSVGLEIINFPKGWVQFVTDFEPLLNKEEWGEIRL
jgi:hypothetical protein